MKQKKKIFDYIESNTGWTIAERPINVNFPLHIKGNYELWGCTIAGINIVLAKVKEHGTDIRRHKKAIEIIQKTCRCNAVLVFESLDGRSINRFIKNRTPFLVNEKYIYLPFALMQIETGKVSLSPPKKQKLTPAADTILVGYLDGALHSGMMIKDIAEKIERDMRATSAALSVLEALEYIHLEKRGRSKIVDFVHRLDVFERLKVESKSPVKYTFYTDSELVGMHAADSGYTALSKRSTLMEGPLPTIAISDRVCSALFTETIKCEEEDARYRVEAWDRDPFVFTDNNMVNSIYLLRLFEDDNNERTAYALEEVEEQVIQNIKAMND